MVAYYKKLILLKYPHYYRYPSPNPPTFIIALPKIATPWDYYHFIFSIIEKSWETVSVNGDVEVIILGEDLEGLVQIRAYKLSSTIS